MTSLRPPCIRTSPPARAALDPAVTSTAPEGPADDVPLRTITPPVAASSASPLDKTSPPLGTTPPAPDPTATWPPPPAAPPVPEDRRREPPSLDSPPDTSPAKTWTGRTQTHGSEQDGGSPWTARGRPENKDKEIRHELTHPPTHTNLDVRAACSIRLLCRPQALHATQASVQDPKPGVRSLAQPPFLHSDIARPS